MFKFPAKYSKKHLHKAFYISTILSIIIPQVLRLQTMFPCQLEEMEATYVPFNETLTCISRLDTSTKCQSSLLRVRLLAMIVNFSKKKREDQNGRGKYHSIYR